jgi:hypothetical protein
MGTIAKSGTARHQRLRRYTSLESAIDLLTNKRLTLLDPTTWDDRNDSYYLSRYKDREDLQTVLALCLSTVGETYHHWHVFCGRTSGVCLVFGKKKLLADLGKIGSVTARAVDYMTLQKMNSATPKIEMLPFIKRYAFRHESEFRVIYTSKSKAEVTHDIAIRPSTLEAITLSPWLPKKLFDASKNALEGIKGWDHISIDRSELISNDRWKSYADRF